MEELPERVLTRHGWNFIRPLRPILTEDIAVCSIGHAFGESDFPGLSGEEPTYYVSDFLIDQSQSTVGGSMMTDPIQFDLVATTAYRYRISAPFGKKIHVNIPKGVNNVYFSLDMGRNNITHAPADYFDASPALITFNGLVGPAPTITYNEFFITHQSNRAIEFVIQGEAGASFAFDRLTIVGRYAHRTFDPGAKWYEPLSYSVPFGTQSIWPKSETHLHFSYSTTQNHDPGRFVTIG